MRICPNTHDQKLYPSSHMCGYYKKNPSLAKWILPSMDILEQDHTLFAKTYTLFITHLIRIPTQHWCIPLLYMKCSNEHIDYSNEKHPSTPTGLPVHGQIKLIHPHFIHAWRSPPSRCLHAGFKASPSRESERDRQTSYNSPSLHRRRPIYLLPNRFASRVPHTFSISNLILYHRSYSAVPSSSPHLYSLPLFLPSFPAAKGVGGSRPPFWIKMKIKIRCGYGCSLPAPGACKRWFFHLVSSTVSLIPSHFLLPWSCP